MFFLEVDLQDARRELSQRLFLELGYIIRYVLRMTYPFNLVQLSAHQVLATTPVMWIVIIELAGNHINNKIVTARVDKTHILARV